MYLSSPNALARPVLSYRPELTECNTAEIRHQPYCKASARGRCARPGTPTPETVIRGADRECLLANLSEGMPAGVGAGFSRPEKAG